MNYSDTPDFQEIEEEVIPVKRDFNYPLMGVALTVLASVAGAVGYTLNKSAKEDAAARAQFYGRYDDAVAVVDTSTKLDTLTVLKRDLQGDSAPEMPDLIERVDNQMKLLGEWQDLQSSVAQLQSDSVAAVSSLEAAQSQLARTQADLKARERNLAHAQRLLELSGAALEDAQTLAASLPSERIQALASANDILSDSEYQRLRGQYLSQRVVAPTDSQDTQAQAHYGQEVDRYVTLLDAEVIQLVRTQRDQEALQQAQSEKEALESQLTRWRGQYGQDLSRLSDAEKRRLLTEYFAQRKYFRVSLSSTAAESVEKHMAGECNVSEGPWGEGCSNYSTIEEDYQNSLRSDDAAVRARTELFVTLSTRDRSGRHVTLRMPYVDRSVLSAMQEGIRVFYPQDNSKIRGVAQYEILLASYQLHNPNDFLQIESRWKRALEASRTAAEEGR